MQTDLLDTMINLYQKQGISTHRFDASFEQLSEMDYQFRQHIMPDYDYSCLISVFESIPVNTVCWLEDSLKMSYSIYHLSEELQEEYHFLYLCLGPVQFQPLSSKLFYQAMEQMQIHADLYREVQEFYNRVPLLSDADMWHNTLLFFLSRLSGSTLEYMKLQDGKNDLFLPFSAGYAAPKNPAFAWKTIEDRYAMEEKLMHAVSIGNFEQAVEAHVKFLQYKLMPRIPDPIRNQKNMLFVLNTLLRKAVQAGGVHPLYIDDLSSQFAIQIEAATTIPQLDNFRNTMLRKYCLLVKNYSRNAYSALIRTSLDYIDFHYKEELSLDHLAKLCSVSSSYLSTLFKKETGVTVTDYINGTRVRQALLLLNSTSLSIQEISEQCGFSDSNYFTRTFKKFQGKSPKSYRESIRKY